MANDSKHKPIDNALMGRRPLFRSILKALHLANSSANTSEIIERIEHSAYQASRRDFLKQSGAWSIAAGLGPSVSKLSKQFPTYARGANAPKVAIVGAGLAGLNCAFILRQAGIVANIYEAATRVGGRIYTATDLMAPELTTELGGEFISSHDHELIRLAKLFELKPIDFRNEHESKFDDTFVVRGHHYSTKQMIDGLRKATAIIKADNKACGSDFKSDRALNLDKTPLSEYLNKLPLDTWLKAILYRACVSEFGLETEQLSSLNLIAMLGQEQSTDAPFSLYGSSTKQYTVKGGNEQLVQLLGEKVVEQQVLEHSLEAISTSGSGYKLAFQGPGGKPVEVSGDIVVLAIPFSVLRNIPTKIDLPETKQKAIKELGYATHTKLALGFRGRYWRDVGLSGTFLTDEQCQSGWDSSRGQAGDAGSITLFFGGAQGLAAGQGTGSEQWSLLKPGLEKVLPGAGVVHNGAIERLCWPKHPQALGSYSCYKLGQWSTIRGTEAEPVGNLFFAGEHCSPQFQRTMNGAAQSGRDVAIALLSKLGRTAPELG